MPAPELRPAMSWASAIGLGARLETAIAEAAEELGDDSAHSRIRSCDRIRLCRLRHRGRATAAIAATAPRRLPAARLQRGRPDRWRQRGRRGTGDRPPLRPAARCLACLPSSRAGHSAAAFRFTRKLVATARSWPGIRGELHVAGGSRNARCRSLRAWNRPGIPGIHRRRRTFERDAGAWHGSTARER